MDNAPGLVLMGLAFGSVYALSAVGFVMIYSYSRTINFAQIEVGAVGAALAVQMRLVWHAPLLVSVIAGLIVGSASGALSDVLVLRRFARAPRLLLPVVTIGVAQVFRGAALILPALWRTTPRSLKTLASPHAHLTLSPFVFNFSHLVSIASASLLVVLLAVFLRRSPHGIAFRAAAANPRRASLLGIPVSRFGTLLWASAGGIATLTILLNVLMLGSQTVTDFSALSGGLFLRVLAAASLGGFQNLWITATAALGIGVAEQAGLWSFRNGTYVETSLALLVVAAVILRNRLFREKTATDDPPWPISKHPRPPALRPAYTKIGFALLIAGAVAVPMVASRETEQIFSLVCIYALAAISLVIVTGWAGRLSLGQFAIAGVGGAITSALMLHARLDLFVALICGMAAAAGVSLVVALPSLRMQADHMVVTTLALTVACEAYLFRSRYFPFLIADRLSRPLLFGRVSLESDAAVYYLCLTALILVAVVVRSYRQSRAGRALIAVRDNRRAAQAVAVNPRRLEVQAFVVSGAIAGLAGGLFVLQQRGLHALSFGTDVNIRLLSMSVIGGISSLAGGILGAVYVRGVEVLFPNSWAFLFSGAGVILLLMLAPGGLAELVQRLRFQLERLRSQKQVREQR